MRDKATVVVDKGEEIAFSQLSLIQNFGAVHAVGLPQVVGHLDLELSPVRLRFLTIGVMDF